MAIRLADVYTQSLPASSDYPGGGFKNATSSGGNDGTPLDQAWANDFLGFFQAILLQAGVTANGSPDNARASQYLEAMKKISLQSVYPIGSVYTNAADDTDPATLLGFGTWAVFAAGRMLLGAGGGFSAGQTGGEVNHTLTTGEMPSHTHAGANSGFLTYPYASGGNEVEQNQSGNPDGPRSQLVTGTGSTGGGAAHNNMPPFITVYMWRRTA